MKGGYGAKHKQKCNAPSFAPKTREGGFLNKWPKTARASCLPLHHFSGFYQKLRKLALVGHVAFGSSSFHGAGSATDLRGRLCFNLIQRRWVWDPVATMTRLRAATLQPEPSNPRVDPVLGQFH